MLRRHLAIALVACSLASSVWAQVEARGSVGADDLVGVLAGIVHYTRWPEAPASLRVCVNARDELATPTGARRLAEALGALGPIPIVIEGRQLDAGPASVLDCQALFVGELAPAAAEWQLLLKDLLNQPVLTIGFGADFCSWGGQFCLERSGGTGPGTGDLRIRANLDAISRSGLRVNPQLLRLTQRDPKVPR